MTRPSPLSRRDVFRTAAALGVGGTALALSNPASAADALPFAAESGLVTGKPKKLKYEEIPGLLTKAQVTPHYTAHYGGALKRFVAIEEQMDKLFAGKEPAAGDAHIFAVKDRVNKMNSVLLHELYFDSTSGSSRSPPNPSPMNSVLLHELYFDGLAPKPPEPGKDLRAEIGKRFGRSSGGSRISRRVALRRPGGASSPATR